jgi:hypothetical protein
MNRVLCQGATLVVPPVAKNNDGLSRCGALPKLVHSGELLGKMENFWAGAEFHEFA